MGVFICPVDAPEAEYTTLACWGDDPQRSVPTAEFAAEAAAHTATCNDCKAYDGPCGFPELPYPTMQVTASSLMTVMEEIGYPLQDPWSGTASAEELKLLIDSRPERLSPRADALAEMVSWAVDNSTDIRWS